MCEAVKKIHFLKGARTHTHCTEEQKINTGRHSWIFHLWLAVQMKPKWKCNHQIVWEIFDQYLTMTVMYVDFHNFSQYQFLVIVKIRVFFFFFFFFWGGGGVGLLLNQLNARSYDNRFSDRNLRYFEGLWFNITSAAVEERNIDVNAAEMLRRNW